MGSQRVAHDWSDLAAAAAAEAEKHYIAKVEERGECIWRRETGEKDRFSYMESSKKFTRDYLE